MAAGRPLLRCLTATAAILFATTVGISALLMAALIAPSAWLVRFSSRLVSLNFFMSGSEHDGCLSARLISALRAVRDGRSGRIADGRAAATVSPSVAGPLEGRSALSRRPPQSE